ncbi:MAG: alpha/beta fold hydrolase [Propionibacteriaceae bacterium]|nr:alpha/beta fold hydrolase [Propionibacteriaceae bacterium]
MVDRVQIPVPTERGTVLPGTLFREGEHRTASTCVVAITGIHGNFWSNPFYFPMGDTLATAGIDFVYAETSDARGEVETVNVRTGRREIMGSFNEDFAHIDDDVGAYVEWARREGYDRVVLAGHSLGANKVIHYLSTHRAPFVSHFVLLSPANMDFLLNQVDARQRDLIDAMVAEGRGGDMLPFALFGWAPMLASTAYQWTHDNPLDSVHLTEERDFSQVERVEQPGALFIGTFDAFALGTPTTLVETTNAHFPRADENRIIIIPRTGHTYQDKEQYTADALRDVVLSWQDELTSEETTTCRS